MKTSGCGAGYPRRVFTQPPAICLSDAAPGWRCCAQSRSTTQGLTVATAAFTVTRASRPNSRWLTSSSRRACRSRIARKSAVRHTAVVRLAPSSHHFAVTWARVFTGLCLAERLAHPNVSQSAPKRMRTGQRHRARFRGGFEAPCEGGAVSLQQEAQMATPHNRNQTRQVHGSHRGSDRSIYGNRVQ